MAHEGQKNFVLLVKEWYPEWFRDRRVLDVGSYDVNGSVKDEFTGCEYVGLDVAEGPNVDIVSPCHLHEPDRPFDTIISCEAFEHDRYLPLTLKHIVHKLLRPKGSFIFTCATAGRKEHGTASSLPEDCPAIQNDPDWKDYYRPVTVNDVCSILDMSTIFSEYLFQVKGTDLYFYGVKREKA
jgi:SAM-dependent methyltransferase